MLRSLLMAALLLLGGRARAANCDSNVLITLDRSCTMNEKPTGDPRTKWQIAIAAINSLTSTFSGKLRFGLLAFPDQVGEKCMQDEIQVPIGAGNETKIAAYLADANHRPGEPWCVTPIGAALEKALTDPAAQDPTRSSFVLLITDGKETCMTDPEVTQRVQQLMKAKIRTYVVGFGSAVDPKQLTDMAVAGGVAKDGKTYYQADSAAALEAALKVIAGSAIGDPDNPGAACSGVPCPDGKCDPGFVCVGGVCMKQQPDGGASGDAARPGGGAAAPGEGCSCDIPGQPAEPMAAGFLALLVLASFLFPVAQLPPSRRSG